jgi:hypothetical protein
MDIDDSTAVQRTLLRWDPYRDERDIGGAKNIEFERIKKNTH